MNRAGAVAALGGVAALAAIPAFAQRTGAQITAAVTGNALDVGIADTIEVGNAISHDAANLIVRV